MKRGFTTKFLLAVLVAVLTSGCLVRRTVTSGGETISSTYTIKRPIKEAIENSQ